MNVKVYLFIAMPIWYEHAVLAKKYDILRKNKISWLSEENITVILNYSFPKSRCCIIYINPNATEEEHTILKWFSTVYNGQEYFIRKRIYECRDHLLVASQSHEIIMSLQSIPVAISTTRILMLIDARLDHNSMLFNASIYKNSNVNLFFRNGSYILSDNYLEPRNFKKISSFKEMNRKTGIVNLGGRELHVSTFYSPPFCFLKTTVNKTIKGIPAKVFVPSNQKEIDGIELHLFFIIAKTLNFTYTLRNPNGRYNHGRKFNDTAWDGGMIGQVVRKEVDIAFSNVWINLDNYEFANISKAWTQIFIQFLVPRPRPFTSFWALTRPLSPTVWFVLLAVLGLNTAYVCGKARLDPGVPRRFRNVVVAFTEMMGRMLGTWLPPIAPRIRLQFVLWELAGFVMVTVYCSSLAARLTNPEFEARIDTVKQFIERNLTWGREGTSPHYKEYFDMKDKYAKQMPSRFILETSIQDRIGHVLQGNHAVVGRIVGDVYYPEGDISNEALETLRVMKQSVGQFYTGFAVQSWLLEPVNAVMMRLKESGLVVYHMQHVIHRRTGTHLREVFVEHDKLDFDIAIVLAINPLGVGFAILIFGLLLASIVFYSEVRSVQGNGTLIQVFKDVRRKKQFVEIC